MKALLILMLLPTFALADRRLNDTYEILNNSQNYYNGRRQAFDNAANSGDAGWAAVAAAVQRHRDRQFQENLIETINQKSIDDEHLHYLCSQNPHCTWKE